MESVKQPAHFGLQEPKIENHGKIRKDFCENALQSKYRCHISYLESVTLRLDFFTLLNHFFLATHTHT